MKRFLGLLLFLLLAEDGGCMYASHLGSPFSWVFPWLVNPLPIKLRGFDLALLGILIASSKKGAGPVTQPMKSSLWLLVIATILFFVWGLFHGGQLRFASWQVYLILSCALLAYTLATVYRTPADYFYLAKWLLAVGVYRAVMCWISYFTWARSHIGEMGAYLTTHDDTIVWVVGVLALGLDFLRRPSGKLALRHFPLILLFLGAIQFNSRRIAWLSLAMGIVAAYFLMPPGKVKRKINRILVIAAPILMLYVAVGWGKTNGIFLPLKSFATVSTKEDASTLARNAENLGLIHTANSWGFLLGAGWGIPYTALTLKYDISGAFELWPYVPHNSILAILAFSGIVGSAIFWSTVATGVFFNVRIARLAADPLARLVGMVGAAQVLVVGNQLYGDMGIFFFKPMYFLAITYAIALRLPRATGVWQTPAPPAPAPAPAPAAR